MIELSAFFYENEYYLFPSCADNVSDLKAYIKNSGIVDLRASMLSSERCYPPCFTDNSVKESVIRDIDPRFIFPATVYMMSRGVSEAEARAREAEARASAATRSVSWDEGQSRSGNTALAALSYLSALFLVPMVFARDDQFARYHAKQGLRLFLFGMLADLIGGLTGIGWVLSLSVDRQLPVILEPHENL